MKAQNIILFLISVIIFPGMLYSQGIDEISDYKVNSGRTNLENTLQTDGYGLGGSNKYLGGLGTSSDYVSIAHDDEFNQTIDGSIEAWVYLTSSTQNNYIFAKGSTSPTTSYSLFLTAGRVPWLRIGNVQVNPGSGTVPLNTWTHLAVTWVDVGTDIEVDFYMNGMKIGNTALASGNMPVNANELRIGGAEYAAGSFQGYIDEVRFWGIKLTQDQIRTNRFVGLGETPASNFDGTNFQGSVSYEELIASWTFNAGLSTFVWEYIGGHYGLRQGNASINEAIFGNPMPYNNALYFPPAGGDSNFVEIRDSAGFTSNLINNGTIELWAKLDDGLPDNVTTFFSKGATSLTNSFSFGVWGNNTGKLFFKFEQVTGTSQGLSVPAFQWFHAAATWQKQGSDYAVNLYLNGELNATFNLNNINMPVNSDPVRIGNPAGVASETSPVNAFLDEIKIWNTTQAQDTIKKLMFASSTALGSIYQNSLLAVWSFDGNLIPAGRFLRMRGTFDVGTVNRCRFSSYQYESSLNGSISAMALIPHISVLKSEDPVAHAFPLGFYQAAPFDTIPFNNVNGLSSIINVGPAFPDNNVSDVQLFISASAPDLEDFEITLTSPNGSTRTVMSNIGGLKDNILTIFSDDADLGVNSPEITAPYSANVRPMNSFGNFDNSPARGNWILNIKQISTLNSAGNGPAVLNGWGIRLNGQTVTGIQNVTTELPGKYELSQNYPNPFNPSTTIKFVIPQSEIVSLKVYDIVGREIATLVNGKLNAGVFEYNFNASALSSGVYFYKLETGGFSEIKKMLLVK